MNKYVFSARLKAFCDKSGDRNAGGRLFQVVGPLTAKLHCPVAVRACGTSRVPVFADRRCCRPEVAVAVIAEVTEVGWSNTTDALPDHQGRLEVAVTESNCYGKSSECQQISNPLVVLQRCHKQGCQSIRLLTENPRSTVACPCDSNSTCHTTKHSWWSDLLSTIVS